MAEVRITAVRGRPRGQVNLERVRATTEEEIRRQALEDGEDYPEGGHDDWHPAPASVRKRQGLTQAAMAEMLRIPVATWRNWEQHRVRIEPAVRALLWVLWREPDAVRRALGKKAA